MVVSSSRARTNPRVDSNPLAPLAEIARNLWWSWNPSAVELFRLADPETFAASDQNPIITLRQLTARRRRELAADRDYVHHVRRVDTALRGYLRDRTWFARRTGRPAPGATAYFCMEYAVHESLPLYAGGLGVLAGDHLKSASDLGIPLVAVGIYWRRGYNRQGLDRAGRQLDNFPPLAPEDTPLVEVTTTAGRPLRLKVPVGRGQLLARAWRLDVGRVPLYLLDSDLPGNTPDDRRLTHILYSGDRESRLRQEILLGVGGWRLLRALDINVTACHLNEGHAAFVSLERLAERRKAGDSYRQALTAVRNTSVFTTHTPVPAGNEEFDPALVDRYSAGYRRQLGLTPVAFRDLARVHAGDDSEAFGLTPLALHTSRYANGVAALHGRIARRMWQDLYPGKRPDDVPIGHITNGVHIRTWLHPRMAALYDEVFGHGWEDRQDQKALWARLSTVKDDEIWLLHQQFKAELVEFCRARAAKQPGRARFGGPKRADLARILDPQALTIGFARRFAAYKRASLVFTNPSRFAALLNNPAKPVQIIFAGKAHPADTEGKKVLEQVVAFARQRQFRSRVLFLENYDMEVARHMVAGVDIWLNNPQRPREASGTSGMKPALHGGLNVSILDGWWPEGFNGRNGWAIGRGEDHDGTVAADRRDAQALYRVLEKEVVPLFFERDRRGLPRKWIARMRNSMMTVPPVFNTHRQVKEYFGKYYLPAMRKG